MKKLIFFKDYLISKYDKPLYRIPINLAMSCPNRQKGGGCSFCPENGARATHLKRNLDLKNQVLDGVKFLKRRYNATPPYIAYFQAYTSTNDSIENIKMYYEEVLKYEDFAMIIIGTRADCLSEKIVDYLSELNKTYNLWVEIGVQTSNDRTLERINRGHDFEQVIEAVNCLDRKKIKTAAHIILGLPGENIEDYLQTANDIAKLPFSGVKVHNLLVLKNTQLAKEYNIEKFETLNEYEYANALKKVLIHLPEHWIIMRINADYDNIIAPKWWMKKGQFLDYFKNFFFEINDISLPKIRTNDGSFTFFHPKYKQHFHTLAGAQTEALKKFIIPSKLEKKLSNDKVLYLLDIGFGLGYNAFEAIKCSMKNNTKLEITSLEQDLETLHISQSLFDKNDIEHKILTALINKQYWSNGSSNIKLIINDARQSVKQLDIIFDIIFLDAFSPDKNPELWSFDFIRILKNKLTAFGVIVTYSAAFPVRGAFIRNNMFIGETPAFGRKKGGTIATLDFGNIDIELSKKELNIICKSLSGVTYRDPQLNWKTKQLLLFRKKILKKLKKMGIPKWYN